MMKLDIQMFADGGKVVIPIEADTKSFDRQIKEVEWELKQITDELSEAKELKLDTRTINEYKLKAEKLTNRLVDLRKKQDELDHPPTKTIEWSENFGDSLKKSIKNVSRLILGIFGIRGAYMAVRSAMNTISSQDEQLSADIQYMKNALAYTIEPIIRGIVNLAKQLMFYVGYIIKAWTGKNIFANANKSLKSSTKSAKALNKELSKTTASFDEMNVLSDTSKGGGDTGGEVLPSFDLSNLGDMKVPGWLQWIVDNKDIILSVLAGIAMGLLAFNLIDFIKNNKELLKIFPQLKDASAGIMALGIGVAVAGLVYAVMSLLDYLKNPTWKNFGKIIQGIGIFVVGLGIAFLGLPGIIAGVLILIVGTVIKYWDEIKAFLLKGVEWLEGSIDAVRDFFGDQVGNIYETFVTAFKGIIIGFNDVFNGLKLILDGIIQFVKGVFTGNWKQAWKGVENIFVGIFQAISGLAMSVISFIAGLVVSIAQTVGYTIADAFKAVVNGVLIAIETILNSPIKAVNLLIKTINKVPGINLVPLPIFKLPRLAKGGIINMPGKGVPVGSAIGGERGAEGVIPLTDSQQMALLGEAIGKYININATIPVYVGNRQIARELRKIDAEDEFARNS